MHTHTQLGQVLSPNFNCTIENLEEIQVRMNTVDAVQSALVQAHQFNREANNPGRFGREQECGWVCHRMMNSCQYLSVEHFNVKRTLTPILDCQREICSLVIN